MRQLLIILTIVICGNTFAGQKALQKSSVTTDSTQLSKISPYTRITTGAKTDNGMFKVYKKGENYYFEIPDSLLGRDILFGSRVTAISNNKKISAGQRRANPVLISFTRQGKTLYMLQPTGNSMVNPNDPIAAALKHNDVVPPAMTFDIVARNQSNESSLIDVTKLFSSEVELVFPAGAGNTGRPDPKISGISSIKAFDSNVEIRSYYNYSTGREPFSISIAYSLFLLSKKPVQPRISDSRINFSDENKRVYSSTSSIKSISFIDHWDIRPREADTDKHRKGELVTPDKPIVFYVDTVMPAKWRKYVREGIETWNLAFEKIGFKNTIKALDYPKSKDFDADDMRFNCFRYIPSDDTNAQGLHWTDPRSGEIIQGDIIWWHNVIDLLQTWRFVQTAAADPGARNAVLSDEMLGDAIRYAVAHEMGHVLGLQHNMRASFAYPTDSLRSPSFTQKYGTTASIMDYARNNFVAQPGDFEKGVRMTPPVLGPFDYFSIEYGYKPFYNAKSYEEEIPLLEQLFEAKKGDPMYGNSGTVISQVGPDPGAQSDMLGNDLVKSTTYAISNLKFILKNLGNWTANNPDLYKTRYDGIVKLHHRLIGLCISNTGGIYTTYRENGISVFTPVDQQTQKTSAQFIIREISHLQWMNTGDLSRQLGTSTTELLKWQKETLETLLGAIVCNRILENEVMYTAKPYTLAEYLNDIDSEIWKQSVLGKPDIYILSLQLSYIQAIKNLTLSSKTDTDKTSPSDRMIAVIAQNQLKTTYAKLKNLAVQYPKNAAHYSTLLKQIEK